MASCGYLRLIYQMPNSQLHNWAMTVPSATPSTPSGTASTSARSRKMFKIVDTARNSSVVELLPMPPKMPALRL